MKVIGVVFPATRPEAEQALTMQEPAPKAAPAPAKPKKTPAKKTKK